MLCFLNPASLFYSQTLACFHLKMYTSALLTASCIYLYRKKSMKIFTSPCNCKIRIFKKYAFLNAYFNCTSRPRPGPGFICFPGKHRGKSAAHHPCPLRQEVLLGLGFVSQDSCAVTALEGTECSMQPQAKVCLLSTISGTETVWRQALGSSW